MIAFVKADITLHQCDALFFTTGADWPIRFQNIIPEHLLDAQDSIPQRFAAAGQEWTPGRLYCWPGFQKTQNDKPSKKVIFPCLGENPDYGAFRDCLTKLKENWQKFGIRSVAMPRIGESYGLDWQVMREMLVVHFMEVNPPANEQPAGLLVEVYEEDVPGKQAE